MGYFPFDESSNLVELAVADGAVTVFPFTDTSGTTVTDSAPGKYVNAVSTYGSGITLAQAPTGGMIGAVDLPGTAGTQLITVLSYANQNLGAYNDAFTFETVAQIDGAGTVGDGSYATIFGYNSSHRFLVHTTTGALLVSAGSGLTAASSTFPIGSYFHMIFTFDPFVSTKARLWVNGSSITLTGDTTAQILSGTMTKVGGYDGANYMLNGRLGLVAIYRYPLTSTQVAAHYAMARL